MPMAKHYKVHFLVLSISYLFLVEVTAAATATTNTKKALNFIKSSCKTTTYRSLCIKSLSTYANTIQTNPQRLVKTALEVTLKDAQSTKLLIHLKYSEFQTLQDCAPVEPYYPDHLTEAIRELKLSDSASVHQSQFLFHVSKAQTLFTSAEDDWQDVENTCSGRFLSTTKLVQARLVNLRKETSNVISLFNAFAKK